MQAVPPHLPQYCGVLVVNQVTLRCGSIPGFSLLLHQPTFCLRTVSHTAFPPPAFHLMLSIVLDDHCLHPYFHEGLQNGDILILSISSGFMSWKTYEEKTTTLFAHCEYMLGPRNHSTCIMWRSVSGRDCSAHSHQEALRYAEYNILTSEMNSRELLWFKAFFPGLCWKIRIQLNFVSHN